MTCDVNGKNLPLLNYGVAVVGQWAAAVPHIPGARRVGGFLWLHQFAPTVKGTCTCWPSVPSRLDPSLGPFATWDRLQAQELDQDKWLEDGWMLYTIILSIFFMLVSCTFINRVAFNVMQPLAFKAQKACLAGYSP